MNVPNLPGGGRAVLIWGMTVSRELFCQCRHRVHFLRNPVTPVPGHAAPAVLAPARTICPRPRRAAAGAARIGELDPPELAVCMEGKRLREAQGAIRASRSIPQARHSVTNAIDRVSAEGTRRATLVRIFQNRHVLSRVGTTVPHAPHDDWHYARWNFSCASLARPSADSGDNLVDPPSPVTCPDEQPGPPAPQS
jgi:transposase-like protein